MSGTDLLSRVEQTFRDGLTLEGGFLPRAVPPATLPPPFDEWICAARELPARYHRSDRGVRGWLDALFHTVPVGFEDFLARLSEPQRDRLFSAVSVLGHAYRWNTAPPHAAEYERPSIVLPPGIARPWALLARELGVPRVGNLFAMVLCNFTLAGRHDGGSIQNDEIVAANIEIAHPWLIEPEVAELRTFLLTPIETEARGAQAVRTCMETLRAVVANDSHQVVYLLERLRVEITAMGLPFREFIQRKTLRANSFLQLIQPTTIWGLDEGDGHGPLEGASGPQVGCIQAIDALLGVKRDSHMAQAIGRSRAYMPARQREFLTALEACGHLVPEFVAAQKHRQMTSFFNDCLQGMEAWRRVHQVRGAMYLKGDNPDEKRPYMSTGGVVALEDERISRFKLSMDERVSETLGAKLTEVPVDAETGLETSFPYLSEEDRIELLAMARRIYFKPGDVILDAGTRRAGLYLVQAGRVRVQRRDTHGDLVLARLSAGELFGEMSFIENAPASAKVIAETPCTIDLVPREHVFQLFRERQDFAARFHQSLATLLSRRLARANQLATELAQHHVGPSYRGRPGRAAEVQPLPSEMRSVVEAVRSSGGSDDEAGRALDGVVTAFAFGSVQHGEAWPAIAEAAFRELYPTMAQSAAARALLDRPAGQHHEWRAVDILRQPQASISPVDSWLRRLPTLTGLRDHATALRASIKKAEVFAPQILSLDAAPLSYLDAADMSEVSARLDIVEWTTAAAEAAASRLDQFGLKSKSTVAAEDLVRVAKVSGRDPSQRYHLVIADLLFHAIGDPEATILLDWIAGMLEPAGQFMFASLQPGEPDRAVLECLLDWAPEARGEDDVRRLIAESAFRNATVAATLLPGSSLVHYVVKKA